MKIVFVYLGARLPLYAMLNVRATARRFPEHEVCVVSDRQTNVTAARMLGATGWQCSDPSSAWSQVRDSTRFRLDFRRGFWFLTVARLFALAEYMEASDTGGVLHVEADVWIAPSFPLEQIAQIRTDFAYPLVSETLGVASTLFVHNAAAARDLCRAAESSAMSGSWLTDMELLSSLQRESPERVTVLPSMWPSSRGFVAGASEHVQELMTEFSEQFGGVFDGMAWGVDVLGEDPRNHWGVLRLFGREAFGVLDTPSVPLLYAPACKLTAGPDETVMLHSIHVHSKDLLMFLHPAWRLSRRVRQRRAGPRATFLPHVFFRVLWSLGRPWVVRQAKRLSKTRA